MESSDVLRILGGVAGGEGVFGEIRPSSGWSGGSLKGEGEAVKRRKS